MRAQTEPCGSSEIHKQKLLKDSEYAKKDLEFENAVLKNSYSTYRTSGTVYKVPVVVHIVHKGETLGSGTNLTDQQVQNAIQTLNSTFRKQAGTRWAANGVDVEIEFALAVRDPQGNCTNGITRVNMSGNQAYVDYGVNRPSTWFGKGMSDGDLKSRVGWDRSKYYNIWVVSAIDFDPDATSRVIGYAFKSASHGNSEDGIVIIASAFGNSNSTAATHEMGHALNLYHTFEGDRNLFGSEVCPGNSSCLSDGDKVCDTPPHIRSNSDCVNTGTNSCDNGSSNELFIRNYMDYSSSACQNMFTAGQKARMITSITTDRKSFLQENGNYNAIPYPTDLTINTVTSNSVNLQWSSFGIGRIYKVRYREAPASIFEDPFVKWIEKTTPTSTLAITGLNSCTNYEVQITSSCSTFTVANTLESYSSKLFFTTLAPITPKGLKVASVSTTSATASWSVALGATSYSVRYRPISVPTSNNYIDWTVKTTTATSLPLRNLHSGVVNEIQVASYYKSGMTAYSPSITFTTTNTTQTTTIGTSNTSSTVTPYRTTALAQKMQFIITKAELTGAGYKTTSNILRSLAFNVSSASTKTLTGFTVKIGHTTASTYTTLSWVSPAPYYVSSADMKTVFIGNTVAKTGWNTYNFSSAFLYNGADNIVVEICWNNYVNNNFLTSTNSLVYASTTTSPRTMYNTGDILTATTNCSKGSGIAVNVRPNVRLAFSGNIWNSTTKYARVSDLEELTEENSVEENVVTIGNNDVVKLYPNPVQNEFNIELNNNSENSSEMKVVFTNLIGEIIAERVYTVEPGTQQISIDMKGDEKWNSLANGLYFCNCNINGITKTIRFAIQK